MASKMLYRIVISGRVQGVGFRWNAAKEARLRGITGFVKNMPGGVVFIEAEGDSEILDDFVRWCHEGPAFSDVESVNIEKLPSRGYNEFRIAH